LRVFGQALALSEERNASLSTATNLGNIASIYASRGEFDQALLKFERSLQMYEEIGAPDNVATSHQNIADVYKAIENYKEALRSNALCLAARVELGVSKDIAVAWFERGKIFYDIGDQSSALQCFETANDLSMSEGEPYLDAQAMIDMCDGAQRKRFGIF
jgi:tetratricopeptide (TPR) repeat protein